MTRPPARRARRTRRTSEDPPRPWPTLDGRGFPAVRVTRVGNDLRFHCPYCGCTHNHGAGDGADDWHRANHCHSDAGRRAFARGYILKIAEPEDGA